MGTGSAYVEGPSNRRQTPSAHRASGHGSRTDAMPTMTDTITTTDGSCPVTVATPEGDGPWPGVVMYPDAGGARQTFTEMAQRLADLGYVVLVPDVYYRDPGWAPFEMTTVFSDAGE